MSTQSGWNQEAFVLATQQLQVKWAAWMRKCYPEAQINDPKEAEDRFAEEALKAMQAAGMTKERVLFMVDYVFAREKGELAQEAAGTINCLATLCNQRGVNMGQAAVDDLTYCWDNLPKIREKNATKPRHEGS